MATSDEKVDMSLDEIIKLNKKGQPGRGGGRQGRGGGHQGQGRRGRRNRGGGRGGQGGSNSQDGLRGTRGGGVQKPTEREGFNFRGLKNKGFQRQLSGVSPLNRNPKKNSGQQQNRQGQNQQNRRGQQQNQQYRQGQQRQNQQNNFYGHDNRNNFKPKKFGNQGNPNQRQNFQRSARGGGTRGGRIGSPRIIQNSNFGINNNKRLSLSQKKSQALKALKQARQTLQKIKYQQQGVGNIQLGNKRRNSPNILLNEQPPIKRRRQWRQPNNVDDNGIIVVNVHNESTSPIRGNYGRGNRRRLNRLKEPNPLRRQIAALKPSQQITYKMEKQLFSQPSTSLSLSERFKQEGRKVFF